LKTDKVKEFLLQYYRDIRPVNEKKKAWLLHACIINCINV
jgi:hypothetical protein